MACSQLDPKEQALMKFSQNAIFSFKEMLSKMSYEKWPPLLSDFHLIDFIQGFILVPLQLASTYLQVWVTACVSLNCSLLYNTDWSIK